MNKKYTFPNGQRKRVTSRFFEGEEPSVDRGDMKKYRDDINNVMSEIERNLRNLDNLTENDLKSFLTSARLFNTSLKANGVFTAVKKRK